MQVLISEIHLKRKTLGYMQKFNKDVYHSNIRKRKTEIIPKFKRGLVKRTGFI